MPNPNPVRYKLVMNSGSAVKAERKDLSIGKIKDGSIVTVGDNKLVVMPKRMNKKTFRFRRTRPLVGQEGIIRPIVWLNTNLKVTWDIRP